MERFFVLSAIGNDRPGIVASVSRLIYDCGCNVEDSRMTLLGEQFALLILLSGSGETVEKDLSEGCAHLGEETGLTLFLSPVRSPAEALRRETPTGNYEVRVVGLDRAGIVYRTSSLLASRGINILDLETRVDPAPESGSQIFTMTAVIDLPAAVDRKELQKELETLADTLHLEISLARLEYAP